MPRSPPPDAPAKARTPAAVAPKPRAEYGCPFCKARFAREATQFRHLCEAKRRYNSRDDKHVRTGLLAYGYYLKHAMAARQPPSFEKFAASQFYREFVAFGRYIVDNNIINPHGFIYFLILTKAKLDNWQSPPLYELYVRELNKCETPEDALERSIALMEQWSVRSGEKWSDFFRLISPAQATLWIKTGRISPWILFTATSAASLFAKLSPEQSAIVDGAIDADFWQSKLELHAEDVRQIAAILDQAGI